MVWMIELWKCCFVYKFNVNGYKGIRKQDKSADKILSSWKSVLLRWFAEYRMEFMKKLKLNRLKK